MPTLTVTPHAQAASSRGIVIDDVPVKQNVMIQRDGATTSLWQDSTESYQPLNAVTRHDYDVIIVGGGITGVSTALQLQQAGRRCLLLEAHSLCFGTTGGTTAHLNTLLDNPYSSIQSGFGKDNAKLVAQSCKDGIALIKNNIDRFHVDCGYEDVDGFLFAQTDDQTKELGEIVEATREAGVALEFTDTVPIPVEFKKAVRIPGQAKFHPTKYVRALAAAYEAAGGAIIQNCRVTGAKEKDEVEIETTQGIFTAAALIYATHIPPHVNLLHLRCAPYRSYAMAVTLQENNYPEGLIYDMYDPYHYYRTQVVNGQPYLIGGGYDHKTAHETNTDKCFSQLEDHLRATFKVAEVAYKWSSQFFEPADGLPYIGVLPGSSGRIYTATGFGGNGMTYSHVSAILLSKLVLQQQSEYEDLYKPARIKPVAGFVNFIKENADVAKEFVGKWLPHEEVEHLATLSHGEGKVVKFNGEKIALSKDDGGQLHAVSPICTHLKCEVQWNTAERSWDCPCHGARYSPDGIVLTGPADMDLEKVELKALIEKK